MRKLNLSAESCRTTLKNIFSSADYFPEGCCCCFSAQITHRPRVVVLSVCLVEDAQMLSATFTMSEEDLWVLYPLYTSII